MGQQAEDCCQAFDKQPDIKADWSEERGGTQFAIIDTIPSALPPDISRTQKRGRRSKELRAKDCENLLLAAQHAAAIGHPLNRFLTVHFDKAGLANPVEATRRLLTLMRDWLRSKDSQLAALWVRESGPEKGEHVHILLSLPPDLVAAFNRRQRGWFKLIGAQRRRGAYLSLPIGRSHKLAFNPLSSALYQQELTGVLDYMLKSASAKARTRFRIQRNEPGGILWGKRCGTTENIARTARGRAAGIK